MRRLFCRRLIDGIEINGLIPGRTVDDAKALAQPFRPRSTPRAIATRATSTGSLAMP